MKKRLIACLVAACMMLTMIVPATLAEETPAATSEVSTPAPTEEAAATEAPAETPAEEPTEAPAEEPAALNEEATEEPTETPTEEPTEVPTEEPTEVPTEVPTEEPTETPTEAPTEVPTEEPTETPTEAPTEVPTEEPTEVPTEAPTEVPTETPTEEPTEVPTETPTEEPTEVPTETPTEVPTEAPTAEPTEEPAAELSVIVTPDRAYAFAGRDSIGLTVEITGGVAPYGLALNVGGQNVQMTTSETGSVSLSYMPQTYGECVMEVVVTDVTGAVASGSAAAIVAAKDTETEAEWKATFAQVELTGDWRADLVAIAATQVGYAESYIDFILEADGRKSGYTRYGDWFGDKYGEWCTMFVSFCMNYAEVKLDVLPNYSKCAEMKSDLAYLGIYEDSEYEYVPQAGDLIFFNWDEKHENNEPEHIGIVEKVDEKKVYVIEGNHEGAVCRTEYALADGFIVGYANMTKMMDRAGKLESTELDTTKAGATAHTTGTNINLRADATTSSEVVVRIDEAGSELTVLGAKETGEIVWYQVQYGEYTGYIRSDLVAIVEATAEPTVEPTAEPTAAPTVEPTVEPTAEPTAEPTVEPTVEPTEEAEELPAEIVEWISSSEIEVTDEMVARALKAGSVDAMVFEENALIYVRTGEVYASYDAETGYLIDAKTGLIVAKVDAETGMIYPVAAKAE